MQRLKPDPVPAIHPCPEHLADARLAAVYADTKATLAVPWMGVVTMAFAHYRDFYGVLWGGLREICGTAPFVDACRDLRAYVEARSEGLHPAHLDRELTVLGYTEPELARIRDLIEVFSAGNMPYLLIATIARLLLEGNAFTTAATSGALEGATLRVSPAAPLTLIEPHHADSQTAALYADIRSTLGLPFVNTDYRALARWPSYFALAWRDLRPRVGTPAYQEIVGAIHGRAVDLASGLRLPEGPTAAAVRAAADQDASTAEVLAVVRLFQWLLPGLVTNVAVFRGQMVERQDSRIQ